MSPTELQITAETEDIVVTVEPRPPVNVTAEQAPGLVVLVAGNIGPQGPPGKWVSLTQAEYDALSPKDPETLYVIIG